MPSPVVIRAEKSKAEGGAFSRVRHFHFAGGNQAAVQWAGDVHPGIRSGWHRLQPGFPQLAIACLANDFAVPSPRLTCFLLDLDCEAYKAVRAALAACFSALLASDRADLDFLPIVVFPFRFCACAFRKDTT
jgi:hypothetical protein